MKLEDFMKTKDLSADTRPEVESREWVLVPVGPYSKLFDIFLAKMKEAGDAGERELVFTIQNKTRARILRQPVTQQFKVVVDFISDDVTAAELYKKVG